MKKQLHARNRQKGFGATAALFMIALIVGIGSALVYANRDTSGNSAAETAKAFAGVLHKQGADMRLGYNLYAANGGSVDTMTFDSTAGTGLFEPSKKYALQQKAPGAVMAGGADGVWTWNKNLSLPAVGTAAGDGVAMVAGITEAACISVNQTAYGSTYSTAASIPASGLAASALATGGSVVTPGVGNWAAGCYKTTDSKFFYFVALNEA
ncbi:hypothetical protein RY831_14690 [Noviherbaspirillum sp. CPCC 100848]|uniref:Pilus assembly protein PilX n=1 Tax=Noviherbaspirillum album TaxID=3080276 RepID=A0ABU6J9T8_9BURK|nr:hypothetical protein [Noviherbaspirillum sp. CPCC 100848]MEC4720407.1 hypothetical protein [Noviherbaspirillum sp. CPCC 100848]